MLSGNRVAYRSLLALITLTVCACGSAASTGSVDVGGYALAYQCFGEGEPAVIVEAGLGEAPTVNRNWMPVIQAIQSTTRICIYDRAGLGQSDDAPTPRTSIDVAQDLHTLLSNIPVSGPYIFVAHSIGGYHVRVYADLYPHDVAGIILVDTSHPAQFVEFARIYPTPASNEASAIATSRPFFIDGPQPADNPEGMDVLASADQVSDAGSLGSIPLIIIRQSINLDRGGIEGFSLEDKQRFEDLRQRLSADLATLSTNSTHITAETAGHYVHVDEPQLVISAITQMLLDIRNQ
jgi:pimeloyl-ACP methyl ester carboxylesterase